MKTSIVYDRIDPEQHIAEPGDILTTTRWAYRVLAVRPVDSRVWHDRWRCDVEKIGRLPIRDEWTRPSTGIVRTERYRQYETPTDCARRFGMPTAPSQLTLDDIADGNRVIDQAPTEARFATVSPHREHAPTGRAAIADIRARTGLGAKS